MLVKKHNKGSVLVITLILSTILFSIGFVFSDFIAREIERQRYSSDSQVAFLVADSAWECTLYNDFRSLIFNDLEEDRQTQRFSCGSGYTAYDYDKDKGKAWEQKNEYAPKTRGQDISTPTKENVKSEYKFTVVKHTESDGDTITDSSIARPCADVVVEKRCTRVAGSNCEEFASEVRVVGYNSCSSPDKRGDVVRRLNVEY